MPIRINLLAEAQAAEESRRRDPVKRAIWMGSFLVAALLAYASLLQARVVLLKTTTGTLEAKIQSISADYEQAVADQQRLDTLRGKLAALDRLSTNRLLSGNMMNAIQRAATEDVRLMKVQMDFEYALQEETKPKTNSVTTIPGKPATSTERILLRLEAKDSSLNPGDRVEEYKAALGSLPYFANGLSETNEIRLTGLTPPMAEANGSQYVLFTLECPYPEVTR